MKQGLALLHRMLLRFSDCSYRLRPLETVRPALKRDVRSLPETSTVPRRSDLPQTSIPTFVCGVILNIIRILTACAFGLRWPHVFGLTVGAGDEAADLGK